MALMPIRGFRVCFGRTILLLSAPFLVACSSGPKERLSAPRVLVAPYDTSRGEVLVAFVPLANESGVSSADTPMITDRLVAAAEEVQGLRTVPLNRTIQAMGALNMRSVRTPTDARQLAQAMGVDAIIVGSLTAYDPYTPVLGLTLAMYARLGSLEARPSGAVNSRAVTAAATDRPFPASGYDEAPVVVVSEHLDAKNHQVQAGVQAFAEGRVREVSALGWRRYTASMPHYTEFAAFRMMDSLMQSEWVRMGRAGATAAAPQDR